MLSIDKIIYTALQEDIGSGDITTNYLINKNDVGNGVIVAKERLVIAGLEIARKVFSLLDPDSMFDSCFTDGDEIDEGQVVSKITGNLRSLLEGERTALNFLQKLSGIATQTRAYVKETQGTQVRLVDTRKTTPGWRILEKYAVRMGGGYNHRMGLYDGLLIKDNHIAVCGGISEAVKKAKNRISHLIKIEVEASSLNEVYEALSAGVDVIMLDNMNIDEIKKAVKIIDRKTLVEISGGVTLEELKDLLLTGVDLISIGALTHSAVAVDLSMRINSNL